MRLIACLPGIADTATHRELLGGKLQNTGVRAEQGEALNTSITVPKLLPPSVPPIPRVFVAIRRLTPAPGAALGAARSPIFHTE